MNTRNNYITVLFLIVFNLAILMPKIAVSAEGIRWYPYNEGITKAASSKKKIFLHFYAQWCPYCERMNRESFTQPNIISFLNENFVSIRVDIDKENKLAAAYNVRGVPANWFLSESGRVIGNLPGYVAADRFRALLEYIHSDEYKKDKN
jgi:thioredoxin 1